MNIAYAAGFFDGGGCVGFSKVRNSCFPRVLIVNTNLEILKSFQEEFGGDIKPLSLRKEGWKQGYCLRISWSGAVEFLDTVYPFLRIKNRQADTVFAWDSIRLGKGYRPTEENIEAVGLLKERMTWLNKKGPEIGNDPIDEAIAMSKAGKSNKKSERKK